jgi:hypothetical protein
MSTEKREFRMETDESYRRVEEELYRIKAAIEELTPLRSFWNGNLRLETTEGERGSKSFICDIVIRPDLVFKPMR